MGRVGRATVLTGWVLGLALLLGGLLAMGDGVLAGPSLRDPGGWSRWLAERPASDAAMAVLRLVAIALTGYLLLATGVAVALRLGDAGRLVAVADVVTMPLVRRVVQAGLGLGLAGAAATGLGARGDAGRAPTAPEVALVSTAEIPALERADAAPPILRRIDVPEIPTAPGDASWTVAPGDHLWSIAERVLLDAWGRPPTVGEITPFWDTVVEVNRDRLADADNPDLLFPGQVLDVPAPPPPA